MKAVVLKKVGVLEVQDVPDPEPEPDEIKVKIAYAGICGSDLKIIDGAPQKTPLRTGARILGHEASGTIVKIGKNIRGDFKAGQRVAMNFRSVCGVCYYCTNGMPHFCERVTPSSGAMAEYAVYRENLVFLLPNDLPLDIGAFLEPVSIAVRTLDIAQVNMGDSVIITGGGPIGLLILQLAIKSGASKVLVSEPIAEKRKLAKQLGADVVVDPLGEDLLEISNRLTDGRGFNVCFEASGIPAIARQLLLLAEGDGTIVWVANYPQNLDVEVPITYTHSKELTIRTIIPSPNSFPRALQMLPKLDLKPLMMVYPLKEAISAFEAHRTGKAIKIMLKP
jgi:(R,R)-butanediol dehydrogenase/meso-butanediol dehydrogenase/diacetyl reductase/L-iditol 2-dehydrogenase